MKKYVLGVFATIFLVSGYAYSSTVFLQSGESISLGSTTVQCGGEPQNRWPKTVSFFVNPGDWVGCSTLVHAVTFRETDDIASKCNEAAQTVKANPNWRGWLHGIDAGEGCVTSAPGTGWAGIREADVIATCISLLQ